MFNYRFDVIFYPMTSLLAWFWEGTYTPYTPRRYAPGCYQRQLRRLESVTGHHFATGPLHRRQNVRRRNAGAEMSQRREVPAPKR